MGLVASVKERWLRCQTTTLYGYSPKALACVASLLVLFAALLVTLTLTIPKTRLALTQRIAGGLLAWHLVALLCPTGIVVLFLIYGKKKVASTAAPQKEVEDKLAEELVEKETTQIAEKTVYERLCDVNKEIDSHTVTCIECFTTNAKKEVMVHYAVKPPTLSTWKYALERCRTFSSAENVDIGSTLDALEKIGQGLEGERARLFANWGA